MSERVSFVVSLWIRDDDVSGFEAYERAAADIMSRHGGRVETVVRCSGAEGSPFEVHVVNFPGVAAFQAYRDDPRLMELRSLRDRVIARTEIWRGTQKPMYDSSRDNNG